MSDLSLTVSGLPFKPIGMSVTYAANSIPTYAIEVDPTSGSLCDIEGLRRKIMNIGYNDINGNSFCVSAFFDDIILNQSRSGFAYSCLFKSLYQVFTEVSCRFPGVSTFSQVNPFSYSSLVEMVKPNTFEMVLGSGRVPIEDDTSVFQLCIKMLEEGIKAQQDPSVYKASTIGDYPNLWEQVVGAGAYNASLQLALSLLPTIDTTAVDKFVVQAAALKAGLMKQLADIANSSTIWTFLLAVCESFGAKIVIGGDRMMIVPENGFIQVDGAAPGVGQISNKANLIFPAQIDNLSYNGNGYVDISSCYVVGETPNNNVSVTKTNELGVFVDESSSQYGGALVLAPPDWFYEAYYFVDASLMQEDSSQSNRQAAVPERDGGVPDPAAEEEKRNTIKKQKEQLVRIGLAFMNKYAQAKYYQAKYRDRIGSVSCNLYFKVCPATGLKVYTRYPAMFLNGYVESVTHSIRISTNGGTAATSVSFSHGRLGNGLGIDSDAMFAYDNNVMQQVQNKFISSIGAS